MSANHEKAIPYLIAILLCPLFPAAPAGAQPQPAAESVYLTTDRTIYFAGEDIWLSPVCLDAGNRVSDQSKVMYIELLTAGNEPVVQSMLMLDDGRGSGSLTVPSYVSSGFYLLRAYTNDMKNFGTSSFFYKKLMILNPVQGGRFNYPEKKTGTGGISGIRIYPEGGTIFRNLYNRVYVQLTNPPLSSGMQGWVVDQYYDTLAPVHFLRNDLAWFDFVPGTPKYFLSLSGYERWCPLDISRSGGSLLKVEPGIDRFAVSLETHDSVAGISPLFLEIRNAGDPQAKMVRQPFSGRAVIENASVGGGFNRLTIQDAEGKSLARNYIYIKPMGALKVNVEPTSPHYGNREKAGLDIHVTDASGNPVQTILTVSVRKRTDAVLRNATLPSYLTIPEPFKALAADWNFDNPYQASAFLARFGDSLFLPASRAGVRDFQPDRSGITVNGRLEINGSPVPDTMIYLSVIGDSALLWPRKTDKDGRFSISVHDLKGNRDIVVKGDDAFQNATFTIDDEYFPEQARFSDFPDQIDSAFTRSLNSLFFAWQVQKLYQLPDSRQDDSCISKMDFFGEPDFSIRMKDYVELPLLEEVFYEIVPPVMVLHKNKEAYLRVVDSYTNRTLGDRPLYLVDGVPLFDPAVIMKISPSVIREIKVVQRQYFLGPEIFDGIIAILTKSGDFSDVEFKGDYSRKEMHFADRKAVFTAPVYADGTGENPRPDFRNVLLWEPNVETGPDGSLSLTFFTSDDSAEYEAVVNGLDASGRACYGACRFRAGTAR